MRRHSLAVFVVVVVVLTTVETRAAPADLSVSKTGPNAAEQNSQISYTISVTNNGPDDATDVELNDTLPAGTTFVSLIIPAGWGCTTPAVGAGGTVTCTRLTMPVGLDEFILTITTPSITVASISNTATVTSANEGGAGNESGTAVTTIIIPAVAQDIPTISEWTLLMLAMTLAAFAVMRLRT